MPYNKEEAKKKIQDIINDFKAEYQKYRKELEANTETKLIEPLFKALGWTQKDFVKQEKAHRGTKTGHADYAFYIGDRIVFFLEVKKVGVYLEKEADKQVISYALSKRIPFAVSTNFEQLRIFCVEQEQAINNKFRVFNEPDDYINRFHDLWLLSKENFEQNITLKIAENEGRLKRRVSINKALLDDLMHIRKLIAFDIEKNYQNKYDINEKDDIIQRIIDRLIFIRRCEDVNINPDNIIMLEEIRVLPDNKAYPKLKHIFAKYDSVYNAGLFAKAEDNDCDKIDINGRIIKDLAYYLYESKNKEYIYNFDWIDADVLGQVYEQYLGKILAQTKSGRAKLKEGQAHRKEQGIYYTPTYVVDYIVKNTIQEILNSKKVKAQKIKVLDSACGSGSFLIKSFDYLYSNLTSDADIQQHKIDSRGNYSIKTEILKNNLFGVDLDNKAVEITKLNLLLKAAEKERKLPEELDNHVKQGNSLVDDEQVVGLNAFKWNGEFQAGSFDVIIGNPPYVFTRDVEFQDSFKSYVQKNYFKGLVSISKSHARQSGKVNLYAIFLMRSIQLLKEKGLFGYIIPNNILRTTTYDIIRKFILDNCKILKIVDLGAGVFEGVTASTIILILERESNKQERDKNKIEILNGVNSKSSTKVTQSEFLENTSYAFNITLDKRERKIFSAIDNNTTPMGEITIIHAGGIATGENKKEMIENYKKNDKYKPMLEGKDIEPYYPQFENRYILYERKLLYRARDESIFLSKEKLITQRIGGGNKVLVVSYDNNQYYTFNSTNTILSKDKNFHLKYIVALLNSKLINWYYVNKFTNKSTLTVNISKTFLEQIPIKSASSSEQNKIISIVDRIINLKIRLAKVGDKKTAETKKIEDEIKGIENEIDNITYKLYGISEKEKEIIENSF